MITCKRLLVALTIFALVPLTGGLAMARSTAKPTLRSACSKDLAKHCKGVKKGRGRWFKCLRVKRAKISKRCGLFLRNKRLKQRSKARARAGKARAANRTPRNPGATASGGTTKAKPAKKSTAAGSTTASEKEDTSLKKETSKSESNKDTSSSSYNDTVWKEALDMPRKGKYVWEKPVKRTNQPTIINIPEAITIAGKVRFVPRSDYGSNCVGFTAAVGMRVINGDPKLVTKITSKNWLGFWNQWMLSAGREGPAKALSLVGLGKKVSLSEAQKGDFSQLWRTNGSGHSVVFKHWVDASGNALDTYSADKAVGLKYISSNNPDGISERVECFYVKSGCSKAACGSSSSRCRLKRSELYIGRIAPQ